MNVIALVTDAHGGFGGISRFNRDAFEAMCGWPAVQRVLVLPRIANSAPGPLPEKLTYDLSGVGGRVRYVLASLRQAAFGARFDEILCGHVNLLPLAFVIGAMRGIPITLVIHGVDAWSGTRLQRFVIRHAPNLRIVSVSQLTLDRLFAWCPFDPARCRVVPNTVNLREFGVGAKRDDLLERYGLTGKAVIMTLGRMDPGSPKGFDRVIAAMPRLRKSIPNLVYLAVGDGEGRAKSEALARTAGVSDCVVFAGKVPEESKADILRLADVFVLPSRGEGFGIVFLEAMACGVPVVASRLDGGQEAVLNGRLGLICDPGDEDSLVAAVLEALKRPRAVPEGLDYFSHDRFSERLQAALLRTPAGSVISAERSAAG